MTKRPENILRCLANYMEAGLNPPPCGGCPDDFKCFLIQEILRKGGEKDDSLKGRARGRGAKQLKR